MKLFVFLAYSALAQQDVCMSDCETAHVEALAKCDGDHLCINEANDQKMYERL